MAVLVRAIEPGKCRVCGCSGDSCKLEDGDYCCWVDALRTLCSNPLCVVAASKASRAEAARSKKRERKAMSSPAIPEWMRRRKAEMKRNGRKKVKGRAA